MVLAEKGNENVRNGRRSRGPSPNGHVAAESTSEDESTGKVPVDKIRVGRDYQAVCPELQPVASRRPDQLADRALLVWSPTVDISEQKLDEYITLAKEKYGYNGEQALGMLFWHKHDLERAVLDLANFTPFPDEWSVEDKVLFEQAFQFHGKSFHRIRQMLPDKTIASLVKYYYSWKKTRSRTSLMDKQARKLTAPREEGAASEAGSEGGSNEESDADEKQKWTIHRGIRRKSGSPPRADADTAANQAGEGGACGNCGVACSFTHVSPKGALCHSCFQHWRRTGALRPTSGPSNKRGGVAASLAGRHKRRPPRGMHINHDDIAAMAAGVQGMQMLRAMDREIVSLKRQVQQNKQSISALKRKTSEGIDDVRPPGDSNASRINARWTNEELLLAVQGVRKYGKDFKTIAETLGTKTESHLRSFFVNYRRRYNLDSVLRDFEKDNGPVSVSPDESMELQSQSQSQSQSPEKMDIDIDAATEITATMDAVPLSLPLPLPLPLSLPMSVSVSPTPTLTTLSTPTPTPTSTPTPIPAAILKTNAVLATAAQVNK